MGFVDNQQGVRKPLRVAWLRIKLALISSVMEVVDRWPRFTWKQKAAILVLGLWPTGGAQGIVYTLGQLFGAFVLVYLVVSFMRSDSDGQETDA